MSDLFRKEALERLSSPERLDELMEVVDPRVWLPMATIGSLLAIGTLWSIFGRIPLTVKGQGLLINPGEVIELQSPNNGQILQLNIQPGDLIEKDEIVAIMGLSDLQQQLREQRKKLADLQRQDQETTQLRTQRLTLQRQDLEKQQRNLKKSPRERVNCPSSAPRKSRSFSPEPQKPRE